MNPTENQEMLHSPKDEIDYSKLSEPEREAEFRRRRQEYLAEKKARKKQIKKIKVLEFGDTSSDSSDNDEAVSRSSGSSGIKSDKKKVEVVTPTKHEVEVKETAKPQVQQMTPSKKKLQVERMSIHIQSRKGNDWSKDVLVIGQKTIIFQNFTEEIKRFSKIKLIAEQVQGNPFKIKITIADQDFIFAINGEEDRNGLSAHYYTFGKLIQMRLTEAGIKLKESVQEKIAGAPESLIAGSIVYGRIHKKSQVLGNWEERFVLINKEGIFSFKKFNQKHSMFIAAGSINELWTRFEVQDNLLIVKIWHSSKKTEFGFPLAECLSVHSWLYGFFCMMGPK